MLHREQWPSPSRPFTADGVTCRVLAPAVVCQTPQVVDPSAKCKARPNSSSTMYKRRFSAPLHPKAFTSATATATTHHQQPSIPAASTNSQQQTTLPPGRPSSDAATTSTSTHTGKENTAPVVPEAGAAKKPRLFVRPASSTAAGAGTSAPTFHRPTPAAAAPASTDTSAPSRIFSVLYCKRDKFKKKSDKGFQDGIIALKPDHSATLLDTAGKVVTKGKPKQLPHVLESGAILELGNFCCEYDQEVPLEEFKRGTCFAELSTVAAPCSSGFSMPSASAPVAGFKPVSLKKPGGAAAAGSSGASGGPARSGAAATAAGGAAAKTAATGLFDPTMPGAVVVNSVQWQQGNGQLAKGRPVVPVVIDPYLGRHLRPHQREGVSFMYECVMGLKSPEHLGCILADEMGLGKTLQVLTLLWTLLRQGPEGVPVVSKAIVVAPATLVENWGKEVKKWLGQERVRFMKLTNGPSAVEEVNNFKCGTVWKLLIASYEAMRKYGPQLAGSCDLLVCDEGHRLKAKGGNKTIDSLLALNCPKRVVLTGTPVQNNLDEFYALLSFAVPGLLGTFSAFKCVYGDIIARSRDKDASKEDQELGSVRAEELHRRVSAYMLRRTQEVLSKHLPPLAVHTMFCKPSALQVEVYRGLLRTKRITSLLYGVGSGDSEGVLPAITVLKKLCNHPKLLLQEAAAGAEQPPEPQQQLQQQQASMKTAELAASILQQHLPAAAVPVDAIQLSGKLQTLSALLSGIIAEGCKVVVVSTSTTALDMIDNLLCAPNSWRSVRIDGGTSVDERQSIVDNFNTRNVGQVFLLSTRAGGAGLNLIGANHLVLFDCDWNPAADLQAMSRIWRDGQTKPCFVTRLVTAGTIEEKVYQRQMMKSDLADATMQSGAGGGVNRLSHDELKQLFNLDLGPGCSTRKLLESSRAGNNVAWLELKEGACAGLPPALAAATAAGAVTAVNRERQQQQSAEEEAAAAAPGTEQAASAPAAVAAVEDVEALEVEDDDW